MKYPILISVVPVLLAATSAPCRETAPAAGSITLAQAVDRALKHSPRLAAMGHQVDADTARLEGHEGFPNPEISVEVEDFLGSGAARLADSLQVTTAVSQDVPLGGRVGARRRVNEARQHVSLMERRIVEQTLIADVSMAFLEVLAYQRRLENAEEKVSLARETVHSIELQVEAGRATAIEVDKASIVLSLALLDKDRVSRDLLVARQRLASICGADTPFFADAEGSLDRIEALPALRALMKRVDRHPSLLIRAAEVRRQQAALAFERAERVPDLSLSLGYRWLNATADSALVAGVAVPLPAVDRRQGAIGAASHETLRSEKVRDQERLALFQALTEAYQLLAAEHDRARVLQEEVSPKVLSNFEATVEGYRLGRFGYLDLLDAQRTLFEVKEQTLEALVAYQRTAIHLNLTAALPIETSRFTPDTAKGGETP